MLEIKDLHVQFHTSDHEAVRGIDLTVQDGEIMGLVGESGSGKTVTAMMVSGLLRPEQADFRGRILLDGEDLLHAGGQRIRAIQGKDICVVFQEPMSAMDPTMRIGKQVEECLRVHTDLSAQERRQRALQALRDVELPDPGGGLSQVPPRALRRNLQRVMDRPPPLWPGPVCCWRTSPPRAGCHHSGPDTSPAEAAEPGDGNVHPLHLPQPPCGA
mgnify:CR=1 FL=1